MKIPANPPSIATTSILLPLLLLALLTTGAAWGQTIQVGQVSGRLGETVQVPVSVSHTAAAAGLLIRLDYDPAVLEFSGALAGDLVAPGQTVDAYSPEPGRVNLFVAGLSSIASFDAPSGIVGYLDFVVKTVPASESSEITLTSTGTPDIPTSALLDAGGTNLGHTVTPGHVQVLPALSATEDWTLY